MQALIIGLITWGLSSMCYGKTVTRSVSGEYVSSANISNLAFKRCRAKLKTKNLRHKLSVEVVTVDPVKRKFMALCELSTINYKKIAQLKRSL